VIDPQADDQLKTSRRRTALAVDQHISCIKNRQLI
jgi:hypothetical protein